MRNPERKHLDYFPTILNTPPSFMMIDAFDRIRRLGRPDGIGAIGLLLGRVYAGIGERDRALEVWIEAEAGFRKIDRRKEADQVAELIRKLGGR